MESFERIPLMLPVYPYDSYHPRSLFIVLALTNSHLWSDVLTINTQ